MRVLVVEDESSLREALAAVLADAGMDVIAVGTAEDAIRSLATNPALLVLDIALPDGSGVLVARVARDLRPSPVVIAISGAASPFEAFALAQLGVRAYFTKPLSLTQFVSGVEAVLADVPAVERHLVALVGVRPLHEILSGVRRCLLEQAMAVAGGNRTHAAELLHVTRQAVQHMLKEFAAPIAKN